MKSLINIIIAIATLIFLGGCQEKFEMIPPPIPGEYEEIVRGIFVKIDGNGSGESWDDALSGEMLFQKIKAGYSPSDTIYMTGGIYYVGETKEDVLSISENIIIKGGFDPNVTGRDVDISYPSEFETIFSGDINKNGEADEGDSRVLYLSGGCTVSLTGITVKHGYVSDGTERPGIHVEGGSTIYLSYCKVVDNISTISSPAGDAGGPAIYLKDGKAICYKTLIAGNRANNRGGAVRLMNEPDVLVLNSCLLADNSVSGSFGGGVQVSNSNCKVYCINSTVTGNSADKGGAGINGGCWIYIVSSTIVENYCTNGAEGHDVRIESANKAFVINSIITGKTNRVNDNNPNILINGNSYNLTSIGNNIIGAVGGTGSFMAQPTDVLSKFYNDIFNDNVLANNEYFPQTIALPDYLYGSPLISLYTYAMANIPYGDVTLDQRGLERGDPTCVGAYEYK